MLYEQRVLGTEFEQERLYRLLSIDMSAFQSRTTGETHFKAQLSALFSRAWTVFHHQYVVLLLDCESCKSPDSWAAPIVECLGQYGLRAGCSDEFSNLYNIREHYCHAVTAETLARKLGRSERIAQYDAYKLWAIAYSVEPAQRTQYLSSALLQLRESDLKTGSEYVKTLFAYLENGEHLEKTAQKLHIHRNTVVYRIEKMKERFEMNFDSPYCNFQNYIGCMLLELSHIENST